MRVDHLNFRDKMQQAENRPDVLRLAKHTAISGAGRGWFAKFYKPAGQRQWDRAIFSRRWLPLIPLGPDA
jgi:hypothetical protein